MLTKKDLFKIALTVVLLETIMRWPVSQSTSDKWHARMDKAFGKEC